MSVDFTLTTRQRKLQLQSREFAKDIAGAARSAELLPTAEERFLATKPIYEAMVAAGFLRKCIPVRAGGESEGFVELAILAEELYSADASVSLTLIGTLLGLLPILLGGSEEQKERLLAPFLGSGGAPLAAFCATEPGGSANAASPPPGEGVRTTAKRDGARWIIAGRKSWISSASGWGSQGRQRSLRRLPHGRCGPAREISLDHRRRTSRSRLRVRTCNRIRGAPHASLATDPLRQRVRTRRQFSEQGGLRLRPDIGELHGSRGPGWDFRRGSDAGCLRRRAAVFS